MTQYNEGPRRTFVAKVVMGKHRRVKLDTDGKLILAGAGDLEIGTLEEHALEVDQDVVVRLRNAMGSANFVANAAIGANVDVFAAADGKVAPAGTVLRGTSLGTAGADSDFIEVVTD